MDMPPLCPPTLCSLTPPSIPPISAPLLPPLEPIQEEWIHEQRLGLVRRLSMRRIIASRMKAATVLA